MSCSDELNLRIKDFRDLMTYPTMKYTKEQFIYFMQSPKQKQIRSDKEQSKFDDYKFNKLQLWY